MTPLVDNLMFTLPALVSSTIGSMNVVARSVPLRRATRPICHRSQSAMANMQQGCFAGNNQSTFLVLHCRPIDRYVKRLARRSLLYGAGIFLGNRMILMRSSNSKLCHDISVGPVAIVGIIGIAGARAAVLVTYSSKVFYHSRLADASWSLYRDITCQAPIMCSLEGSLPVARSARSAKEAASSFTTSSIRERSQESSIVLTVPVKSGRLNGRTLSSRYKPFKQSGAAVNELSRRSAQD